MTSSNKLALDVSFNIQNTSSNPVVLWVSLLTAAQAPRLTLLLEEATIMKYAIGER